jgi:hypothetical protein
VRAGDNVLSCDQRPRLLAEDRSSLRPEYTQSGEGYQDDIDEKQDDHQHQTGGGPVGMTLGSDKSVDQSARASSAP